MLDCITEMLLVFFVNHVTETGDRPCLRFRHLLINSPQIVEKG